MGREELGPSIDGPHLRGRWLGAVGVIGGWPEQFGQILNFEISIIVGFGDILWDTSDSEIWSGPLLDIPIPSFSFWPFPLLERKGTGNVEADRLSALTVNPSDYTGVSMINCKLNGSNYLTCSRAMLIALTAKNKVGMIDGTVARPPEGDSNRAKWEICNALVIFWIFNTLDSELQSSVACATVAQDLWEDLNERYS
ncbi:hypothetical protein CRG98_032862 [Punica granatum]|uniref:Retrotransposon Copia-like N-terminal domain-containing protein n=1 Tax=Punica granatum TaxID=22663 RepID=A0A2I0IRV1_PUNGR|nr:hypothetical protein CRG98_032862 [Punica granatum]